MKKLVSVILMCALLAACNTTTAGEDDGVYRVIVFGGTGRLGSDIVKQLVADGQNVSVFARAQSSRARLGDLPVTYVIGDVLDKESVDTAYSEGDYHVAVDALGRGNASVAFYEKSALIIAQGASTAGVRQIILHGSVGAGDSAAASPRVSSAMAALFAAKSAGERAVMNSSAHHTIIRNSRLLPYRTDDTGTAQLYEDHLLNGSVSRAALARLTGLCLMNEDCFDKIYHAVDKEWR